MTSCDSRTPTWFVPSWGILWADDLRTMFSRRWLAYFWACLWVGQYAARTAILRPSITGGIDHSLRAMLTSRAPMVFGGAKGHDTCSDRVAVVRPLARQRRRVMPSCSADFSFSYAVAVAARKA